MYMCVLIHVRILILAAKNGVVLAVEKKQKTVLYDESSINKVRVSVCPHGTSCVWLSTLRVQCCSSDCQLYV